MAMAVAHPNATMVTINADTWPMMEQSRSLCISYCSASAALCSSWCLLACSRSAMTIIRSAPFETTCPYPASTSGGGNGPEYSTAARIWLFPCLAATVSRCCTWGLCLLLKAVPGRFWLEYLFPRRGSRHGSSTNRYAPSAWPGPF